MTKVLEATDLQITIPYPTQPIRGRGINAINRGNAKLIVDCQREELDLINAAANSVGLTRSAYVRDVLYNVSKELMK